MWIFSPSGLVMPSITPLDKVDPKLTNDGEFTMQVRARVESHLTNIIRDYFEPMGLAYSIIEATPQMDYNFRFYCSHESMALVAAQQVRDIDFLKFKPTAERHGSDDKPLYKDGKAYHQVLNSIWGSVCQLGTPGGMWGRYSATNPRGWKPKTGVKSSYVAGDYEGYGTASSIISDDKLFTEDYFDDSEFYDDGSWTPDDLDETDYLLHDFADIPREQWEEFMTEHEYALIVKHERAQEFSLMLTEEPSKPARGRRAKSKRDRKGRRFYKGRH